MKGKFKGSKKSSLSDNYLLNMLSGINNTLETKEEESIWTNCYTCYHL